MYIYMFTSLTPKLIRNSKKLSHISAVFATVSKVAREYFGFSVFGFFHPSVSCGKR
jgi:hypothetical protein